MKVKVVGQRGVVTCESATAAAALAEDMPCATHREAARLTFTPNRAALDLLVKRGATFHPDCRLAWGHHYQDTKRQSTRPAFETKQEMDWYQREDFERFKGVSYYALEWDMGLGKSKAFFDLSAYRWCADDIDAVIFVTLAGPHRNLTRIEAPKHVAIPFEAFAWVPSRKGGGMPDELKLDRFNILSFNFEAVSTARGRAVVKRFLTNYRCALIIDESHCIASPGSIRTKELLKLSDLAVIRGIGSGTPVPNTPIDVWAPYTFLSDKILKQDLARFKMRYSIKRPIPGKFTKWGAPIETVVGYRNVEELKPILDPYRSRRTKDILGLPEKLYETRHFDMPAKHLKLLEELKSELTAEYNGRTLTVATKLVLITRIQQLLSGFMPTGDDSPPELDGDIPRIGGLLDWSANVPQQAIVWCTFDFSAEKVHQALLAEKKICARVTSLMPMEERERAQDAFQAGDVQYLVSTPKLLGTGFTLTAASDVLYYESLTSMVQRKQSEDRAHRRGQDKTVTISDLIAAGTPEDNIRRQALRGKHETACIITGDDLDDWLAPSNK